MSHLKINSKKLKLLRHKMRKLKSNKWTAKLFKKLKKPSINKFKLFKMNNNNKYNKMKKQYKIKSKNYKVNNNYKSKM